ANPYNGDKEILISLSSMNSSSLKIVFTRTASGGNGKVDGWVLDSSFAFNNPDDSDEVGWPGVSTGVVTVGSYVTRVSWVDQGGTPISYTDGSTLGKISSFSSSGPTRDGRRKPELTAPGQGISSTLSQSSSVDP